MHSVRRGIEWIGFKLSNTGTVPVERKSESIQKKKRPENISDIRSLIGSMNQFLHFIPNKADATEPFRDLMKKSSRFEWTSKHEKAFGLMKNTVGEFDQNHHLGVRKKTRIKSDASKRALGAALEQFHPDEWTPVLY